MADYPPSPIRQLLRELNLPSFEPPVDENKYRNEPPQCCGPIYHDHKEATLYCNNCGKVIQMNMLYSPPFYFDTAYAWKTQQSYTVPRRYYACRQNFRTYLNQYMGVGPEYAYDETFMALEKHWNVHDPNAYLVGKEFLKKLKSKEASHHYKHLWSFLYRCGGVRPEQKQLGNFSELFQEINTFQNFFYSQDWGFHNVTGTWQILKHLMEKCGHHPYYNFPKLINKDKQQKVEVIICKYNEYVQSARDFSKSN